MPYVFDRYFQSNRPEKPIEGGTGIGLALCKEYVNMLGGTITLESELGKGTTIFTSLPLVLSGEIPGENNIQRKPLPVKKINGDSSNLASKVTEEQEGLYRILLVEDNPELSEYIQMILSDKYHVIAKGNGQVAWDYLMDHFHNKNTAPCDLILSDLMMPGLDGYQLTEKLRSHDYTRHLPVIMLTARADLQDKLKALRIGVDDYIYKPFEQEELKLRIESLLRNLEARKENSPKEESKTDTGPLISQQDQEWLIEFERFVQQNLSKEITDVVMLAENFAMSRSTLLRQLKRLTGLTPAQYLKEARLDSAREMLEKRTYNSISKVAYEAGYADPRSFARAFKRRFGQSPSKFIDR